MLVRQRESPSCRSSSDWRPSKTRSSTRPTTECSSTFSTFCKSISRDHCSHATSTSASSSSSKFPYVGAGSSALSRYRALDLDLIQTVCVCVCGAWGLGVILDDIDDREDHRDTGRVHHHTTAARECQEGTHGAFAQKTTLFRHDQSIDPSIKRASTSLLIL